MASLPTWPHSTTWRKPQRTHSSSMKPTKLLIRITASCGTPNPAARLTPRRPGVSSSVRCPAALAISSWGTRACLKASSDIGSTIPVVPRMEMPPVIPNRGFIVRRANCSPSGTLITTSAPVPEESTTDRLSLIICSGPGLMAG